ncbi:hypothetical protein HOK021_71380 [Streptomyces hygroscopicus]|nr:hypothetical protein HOK021_71380 [Streptomyces hygroscopicus]
MVVPRSLPIAMACGAAAADIPTSEAAIAAPAIIFFIVQTLQENELPAREPCLNNPSHPHGFRIITRTDGDGFPGKDVTCTKWTHIARRHPFRTGRVNRISFPGPGAAFRADGMTKGLRHR